MTEQINARFISVSINDASFRGAQLYGKSKIEDCFVFVTKSYVYVRFHTGVILWNPYEINADGNVFFYWFNERFQKDIIDVYPDFYAVIRDLVKFPNEKELI